jgi:hypothetical protein
MYELGLGIVHLKFRGQIPLFGWPLNLSLETGQNSEPNPPCVIPASHISELPCSELAGISSSVPLWCLIDRTELDMAERPHDLEEAAASLKIWKYFQNFKNSKNNKTFKTENFKNFKKAESKNLFFFVKIK